MTNQISKNRSLPLAGFISFVILICSLPAIRPAFEPAPALASGKSSVFVPDHGKFRIMVAGQQAGTEEFDIAPSAGGWMARGNSEVQSSQGTTHVTGSLQLRDDGSPVHYEWSTQGVKKASSTIEFNGPAATIELHLEGARPFTQQLTFATPRIAVLDNNLYYQYGILAHLYDWEKKGSQSFPVLVPQEMTPGTVSVEATGKQDVGGRKLEELLVKTEDLELDLYLDGPQLIRIVAPSSKAEIIRE
jgi:hypothetical protein